MAIVLLCLIPNINHACCFGESNRHWRVQRRFLLLVARESTSSLLRLEKRTPRTGFREMAQVVRSNRHAVPAKRRIPHLFLRKLFLMSDTVQMGNAFLRFLIRRFVFYGLMATRAKLQIRHRLACGCPTRAHRLAGKGRAEAEPGARLSEWP